MGEMTTRWTITAKTSLRYSNRMSPCGFQTISLTSGKGGTSSSSALLRQRWEYPIGPYIGLTAIQTNPWLLDVWFYETCALSVATRPDPPCQATGGRLKKYPGIYTKLPTTAITASRRRDRSPKLGYQISRMGISWRFRRCSDNSTHKVGVR